MLHNPAHNPDIPYSQQFTAGDQVSVGYKYNDGDRTILHGERWNGMVGAIVLGGAYFGQTHGQPLSADKIPIHKISFGETGEIEYGHPEIVSGETQKYMQPDGSIGGFWTVVLRGHNAFETNEE